MRPKVFIGESKRKDRKSALKSFPCWMTISTTSEMFFTSRIDDNIIMFDLRDNLVNPNQRKLPTKWEMIVTMPAFYNKIGNDSNWTRFFKI